MKRLVSLFGLLVLLALLSAGTALSGPPEYSVSGGGISGNPSVPGLDLSFGFSAQIDAENVVKGEWEYNLGGYGQVAHVDIDCLVVEGNRAWFSGKITQSKLLPETIGESLLMGVEDNGQGRGAAPDLRSDVYRLEGGPHDPTFCKWEKPIPSWEWTHGNVRIKP